MVPETSIPPFSATSETNRASRVSPAARIKSPVAASSLTASVKPDCLSRDPKAPRLPKSAAAPKVKSKEEPLLAPLPSMVPCQSKRPCGTATLRTPPRSPPRANAALLARLTEPLDAERPIRPPSVAMFWVPMLTLRPETSIFEPDARVRLPFLAAKFTAPDGRLIKVELTIESAVKSRRAPRASLAGFAEDPVPRSCMV